MAAPISLPTNYDGPAIRDLAVKVERGPVH